MVALGDSFNSRMVSHHPITGGQGMSIRRTITNPEDVELSENGKELEILIGGDDCGNEYVDIPVEFVRKALEAGPKYLDIPRFLRKGND